MTFDRARAYGDGLFETVAIIGGKPRHWRRHIDRLHYGCRRLGLSPPSAEELLEGLLAKVGADARQVARIAISRQGSRGYAAEFGAAAVSIEIKLSAWPQQYDSDAVNGVALRWPTTRLPIDPALGGLKHLNRLPEVIAASTTATSMAVTMDTHQRVVGATAANLFLRCGHRVYTPPIRYCGVAGVMRAVVLDALGAGQLEQVRSMVVRPLVEDDIRQANEVWITNALRGVCSVSRIGDNAYMSRRVADQLSALLEQCHEQ